MAKKTNEKDVPEKAPKSVLESLFIDLKKEPDNFGLANMIADHFNDMSQSVPAEAMSWLVLHRKRPYSHPEGSGFVWFNEATIFNLGDVESNLPEPVYKCLANGKAVANHTSFDNFKDSYDQLILAWNKAVVEGWDAKTYVNKVEEAPKEEKPKEEQK